MIPDIWIIKYDLTEEEQKVLEIAVEFYKDWRKNPEHTELMSYETFIDPPEVKRLNWDLFRGQTIYGLFLQLIDM